MRVAFVVEDSLPNGRVGAKLTPTLWSLIEAGGWHAAGGRSVLASSTYPNHASFATGTDVAGHRIFTNDVWDGERFVCSSVNGPVGETIIDAARAAGRSVAAAMGDWTMLRCMGADRSDVHWPPSSQPVADIPRDCLGYPDRSVVLDAVDRLEVFDHDLSIVHVNDPDSTLHLHGPGAAETTEMIRLVDADLARLVARLHPRWDETVLFVVSDHEQEQIDHGQPPIDMVKVLADAGLPGHAHNEGTVALVIDGPEPDLLVALPDVEGAQRMDAGVTLVWSGAGRVFGRGGGKTIEGQHGSPRMMTQVATVSGGHPVVKRLATTLATRQPHATDWAPTIADLLQVPLPNATGTSLLAP